jgi:hypothetical protein
MYLDSLVALVPYGSNSEHSVSVPPIMDSGDALAWALMGAHPLTQPHGGTFADDKVRVGWNTAEEQELWAELAEQAGEMQSLAANNQLHEAAKEGVTRLSLQALKELDRIGKTYKKWDDARIAAAPSDSPFSFYKQGDGFGPLPLSESRNWVAAWARTVPDDSSAYYTSFANLLDGERGDWNGLGEPDAADFWSALLAARARDRDRIRDWYRAALQMLWCAEYGVAQSESYFLNGGPKGGGGLGIQAGDAPTPKPGLKIAQFVPVTPPGDQFAPTPPPVSEHPPQPVPDDIPPPGVPAVETPPWHTTTPGKVALGLGAVALAGVAGWGIYRLVRRPAAPPVQRF